MKKKKEDMTEVFFFIGMENMILLLTLLMQLVRKKPGWHKDMYQ